jgi:hypothetical protein
MLNLQQAMKMIQNGGNPAALAQQFLSERARFDPKAARALQILKNNPTDQTAINLLNNTGGQQAKDTFNLVKKQLGFK